MDILVPKYTEFWAGSKRDRGVKKQQRMCEEPADRPAVAVRDLIRLVERDGNHNFVAGVFVVKRQN
jgi:hypothetical protein